MKHNILLIAVVGVALLASGCPEAKVTELGIVPGSLDEGKLTLSAKVAVEYDRMLGCEKGDDGEPEDEDCPGPETFHGHGLVGVWLPDGWKVEAARIVKAPPGEPDLLEPMEYLAPAFPMTFPYVPGRWWPFMTDCTGVVDGVTDFLFEFDVSGPPDEEKLPVGATAVVVGGEDIENRRDVGAEHPQMTAWIDLNSGDVDWRVFEVKEVELDPERKGKLSSCVYAVEPGPRGCSCRMPGGAHPDDTGLLSLILALL